MGQHRFSIGHRHARTHYKTYGYHVHLTANARLTKLSRVLEVLIPENVEFAKIDVRGWQASRVLDGHASCSFSRVNIVLARPIAEQGIPTSLVVVGRPEGCCQ